MQKQAIVVHVNSPFSWEAMVSLIDSPTTGVSLVSAGIMKVDDLFPTGTLVLLVEVEEGEDGLVRELHLGGRDAGMFDGVIVHHSAFKNLGQTVGLVKYRDVKYTPREYMARVKKEHADLLVPMPEGKGPRLVAARVIVNR
jgi:hypothetical protein